MRDVEVIVRPPGYIYRCDAKGQFPRRSRAGGGRDTDSAQASRRRRADPNPGRIREKKLCSSVSRSPVPGRPDRPEAPCRWLHGAPRLTGRPAAGAAGVVEHRGEARDSRRQKGARLLLRHESETVATLRAGARGQGEAPGREQPAGPADPGGRNGQGRHAAMAPPPPVYPFAAGTTAVTMPTLQQDWTVRALPWLVLLDEGHAIRAAGFDLQQLDESLAGKSLDRLPLVVDWRTKFAMVYRLAEGQIPQTHRPTVHSGARGVLHQRARASGFPDLSPARSIRLSLGRRPQELGAFFRG